jgi:hypothetical protein
VNCEVGLLVAQFILLLVGQNDASPGGFCGSEHDGFATEESWYRTNSLVDE